MQSQSWMHEILEGVILISRKEDSLGATTTESRLLVKGQAQEKIQQGHMKFNKNETSILGCTVGRAREYYPQ